MKIKNQAIYRSVVIIVILILSVICGIIYQVLHNKMDLRKYPTDYSEFVVKYAEEFSVPEYLIYGVIKYESSFASNNLKENGAVGLMGISSQEFDSVLKITRESITNDTLYGPETNIKYGSHWLAYEYSRYDNWDDVLLAKVAGEAAVDEWLSNDSIIDKNGRIKAIPDAGVASEFKDLKDICKKYHDLYYSN